MEHGLQLMRKHSKAWAFLVLYPHVQPKGDQTVLECTYCGTKFTSLFFTRLQK